MDLREAERGWRETLANALSEPLGQAMAGMCRKDFERVKDLLVDAPPEQVSALQGEAQSLRRILKYLTSPTLPETPKV